MFRPLSAATASNAMTRPEQVHGSASPPRALRDGGPHDREVPRVVEFDRIPETPMAHQTSSASMPTSRGARQIGAPDVFDFVTAVLGADDAAATALVQGLLAEAVSVEAIYLDLLAPAARELGTRWEEDECSFVDVTVAMGRVHRVLRELSQAFQAEGPSANQAGQILLTCLPGEQHTLGLIMVAEFLIREGFRVHVGSPWAEADLLDLIRTEWFDVVGFSAGCESRLSTMKREIQRLRAVSCNPQLQVLVGGQVFSLDPSLVERVGADGWARDAASSADTVRALCAAAGRTTSQPGSAA
jgi:MerR family transcriptional regulator, light-induced transcriptional regulator